MKKYFYWEIYCLTGNEGRHTKICTSEVPSKLYSKIKAVRIDISLLLERVMITLFIEITTFHNFYINIFYIW